MSGGLVEMELALTLGCEFNYETATPTPAIFLVRPSGAGQHHIVEEHWTTGAAAVPFHDYTDVYGNVCRRLILPPGQTKIRYEARVHTVQDADPYDWTAPQSMVEDLPDDVLVYMLPSRFCLSDQLTNKAWELFGNTQPGWARVQAICNYVHNTLRFAYGSSTPMTTGNEAYENGWGVCRDFAHLAITFLRAMNVPARYVFGYIPDIDVPPTDAPMDFCAWIEVYLGDRWWTFDPRNNTPRKGRAVIGRGRDALDVAMVTTYGPAILLRMDVFADEIIE